MTTDTATTETNVKIENAASVAALALKGRVTRATHLKAGTAYIMREWHKEPVYSEIVFVGFGKSRDALVDAIPQLKSLTGEDKFFIRRGDEDLVADGRIAGNVFLGEGDSAVRVTFSALISAETEAKPEPAPKAPRKARKAKAAATIEAPVEAAAETVIEAPAETVEA
jgi:hypothetical protein